MQKIIIVRYILSILANSKTEGHIVIIIQIDHFMCWKSLIIDFVINRKYSDEDP
jgi:hypothetical protein